MAIGQVHLEQEKATLAKAEAHLHQSKAKVATKELEAVKEQVKHHKEALEKLVKEESRIEATINIQNNIQTQTNIYINSLRIEHSERQDQDVRRHTPVPAPQEPAPTIPHYPNYVTRCF
ncbi:hypothetical protein Ptr902_08270 [Pyrenophora tritici-repentis]|nr:hypothetical protein Ptr902_08270 [Pyrenophora tritici-repentis]